MLIWFLQMFLMSCWTDSSWSWLLNIFQGSAGQRGPEGLTGKPGEDVSQLLDIFTPELFSLVFTALDKTCYIIAPNDISVYTHFSRLCLEFLNVLTHSGRARQTRKQWRNGIPRITSKILYVIMLNCAPAVTACTRSLKLTSYFREPEDFQECQDLLALRVIGWVFNSCFYVPSAKF